MDGARKEPSGLFTTLLPAAAAAARARAMQAPANGATHNRWREIVPDLVISNDGVSRTYDLKIISQSATAPSSTGRRRRWRRRGRRAR